MLRITTSGSTRRTEAFLDKMIKGDIFQSVAAQAQRGVDALKSVTPQETGVTASSWWYDVQFFSDGLVIWWTNDHIVNGFNVAIGLQYGHGTGTGGWVQGQDYINPSIKPIFDDIANQVWKEVQSA